MLSRVTIENFRSLENVRVSLAPLTALAGANGSGKSSSLRAIDRPDLDVRTERYHGSKAALPADVVKALHDR